MPETRIDAPRSKSAPTSKGTLREPLHTIEERRHRVWLGVANASAYNAIDDDHATDFKVANGMNKSRKAVDREEGASPYEVMTTSCAILSRRVIPRSHLSAIPRSLGQPAAIWPQRSKFLFSLAMRLLNALHRCRVSRDQSQKENRKRSPASHVDLSLTREDSSRLANRLACAGFLPDCDRTGFFGASFNKRFTARTR